MIRIARRALMAGVLAARTTLRAQDAWPVRQARIVIPFAAGGPQDIPARVIAEKLSQRLGATFIIDNRPGAGGGLGAQHAAKSAPDGATLLFISASISIIPTLQPALPAGIDQMHGDAAAGPGRTRQSLQPVQRGIQFDVHARVCGLQGSRDVWIGMQVHDQRAALAAAQR